MHTITAVVKIKMPRLCAILLPVLLSFAAQAADDSGPLLTLPPMVYGVVGQETRIFFDNVVLTLIPGNLRVEVKCKLGQSDRDHWSVTPKDGDAGLHPMEITVRGAKDEVLQTARTTLRVAPKDWGAQKKLRLLIVGDSLTHSYYPTVLFNRLQGKNNPACTFLGTHKPANVPAGMAHEGLGGWTWKRFLSFYEPNPAGPERNKASSPFVFAGDKGPQLDVPRYIKEHCDGVPPDVVTFQLGINDCFSANPEDLKSIESVIAAMFDSADKLIAAFRAAAPKAVIGIGLTTAPNSREEAFEANYKGKYTRWGWKRIQHRLVRAQLEHFKGKEKENLILIPTYLDLDPDKDYPPDNAVHPNTAGYERIGNTFYAWVKNLP